MRRLFQTRVFIATALLLLLGAVRCINACQLIDGLENAAPKSCHKSPVKVCGQLHLIAPDSQDFADWEPPIVLWREFAPVAAAAMGYHPAPKLSSPPGWLAPPLRI